MSLSAPAVTQSFSIVIHSSCMVNFMDLQLLTAVSAINHMLSCCLERLQRDSLAMLKGILYDSEVAGICDSKRNLVGLKAYLIGSNT